MPGVGSTIKELHSYLRCQLNELISREETKIDFHYCVVPRVILLLWKVGMILVMPPLVRETNVDIGEVSLYFAPHAGRDTGHCFKYLEGQRKVPILISGSRLSLWGCTCWVEPLENTLWYCMLSLTNL